MEKANYEVKELFLARDPKIRDDAAIVMIPGPKTISSRRSWPRSTPTWRAAARSSSWRCRSRPAPTTKYLSKYGVTVDDDVVIELNPIGQVFGVARSSRWSASTIRTRSPRTWAGS